jgi:nucleotide-binding universal stress UspA family protein
MYDEILLPTDGSSGTGEVIDHVTAIATERDARVHVLYVVDSRLYRAADAETTDEVRRSLVEAGERAVDEARVSLADEGVDTHTECRTGIPNKVVTDYAGEAGIDLVVMGTHGETGSERVAALGSTTERVVKHADVPVLVVDID